MSWLNKRQRLSTRLSAFDSWDISHQTRICKVKSGRSVLRAKPPAQAARPACKKERTASMLMSSTPRATVRAPLVRRFDCRSLYDTPLNEPVLFRRSLQGVRLALTSGENSAKPVARYLCLDSGGMSESNSRSFMIHHAGRRERNPVPSSGWACFKAEARGCPCGRP